VKFGFYAPPSLPPTPNISKVLSSLQSFGALSSDNTVSSYTVPSKSDLLRDPDAIIVADSFTNFSITFSLLLNEVKDGWFYMD